MTELTIKIQLYISYYLLCLSSLNIYVIVTVAVLVYCCQLHQPCQRLCQQVTFYCISPVRECVIRSPFTVSALSETVSAGHLLLYQPCQRLCQQVTFYCINPVRDCVSRSPFTVSVLSEFPWLFYQLDICWFDR